jgi:hypothetical protein
MDESFYKYLFHKRSYFNIEWLAIPGVAALLIRIINPLLYTSIEESALNSLYSIVMSIWAIMFVIVRFIWKLNIKNLVLEEKN